MFYLLKKDRNEAINQTHICFVHILGGVGWGHEPN